MAAAPTALASFDVWILGLAPRGVRNFSSVPSARLGPLFPRSSAPFV